MVVDTVRIFIGYDAREALAYHVCVHSILSRASRPVSIQPIMLSQFRQFFNRPKEMLQSNDFTFARFLAPYLCQYKGWAVFMDCDMLCRADIAELWDMIDESYSVMCVKHDHRPSAHIKYLGATQYAYPRKNWSSVMLLNCDRWQEITPAKVSTMTKEALHAFTWMHESEIGELPEEWNHLVGYQPHNEFAKIVHFTEGGPWFPEYAAVDFSDEWREELLRTIHPVFPEEHVLTKRRA